MELSKSLTKEKMWAKEQSILKKKLIMKDNSSLKKIEYIGGMDISFDKTFGSDVACATFMVLSYPKLEVVYEHHMECNMEEPYISGFLAFREVKFLVELWEEFIGDSETKGLEPQVILVDGHGILHHRGFGLASHLGVLIDKPVIGCAKKLLFVDGLYEKEVKKTFRLSTKKVGDNLKLKGKSGVVHGVALRTSVTTTNPIYVSIGHKISLTTAIKITTKSCIYREPEPIRLADQFSRKYLREGYKPSTKEIDV